MMAKVDDLISVLEALSPMPDDDEDALTDERMEEYDATINALREFKDPKAIVPMINSFGYGDAFGIYWTTLHALEEFGAQSLYPRLIDAVRTGERGPRMWAAYMLGGYRCPEAVDDLIRLLRDENELVRANAALALGMIGDRRATPHLEAIRDDVSREVRSAVEQALSSMA